VVFWNFEIGCIQLNESLECLKLYVVNRNICEAAKHLKTSLEDKWHPRIRDSKKAIFSIIRHH